MGLETPPRRPYSPILLALLLLLAAACSGSERPVARVGNEVVTPEQWHAYLRSKSTPATPADPAEALAEVVRREVAWQLAQNRGLLATAEWAEQAKTNRRDILASAFLASQPGAAPLTEAQAEAFYLAHNQERRVRHILRGSREEAGITLSRLKAGESFEKLAEEFSKDTSAKKNGGDLGWIRREQMVPEFGDAVFQAKVGEYVGPFKSEFGWHVALVEETRGPTAKEFQRDRPNILKKIESMQEGARREMALAPLRKKYALTPDPEVLDLDRTLVVVKGDDGRIAGRLAGEPISLKELKVFIAGSLNTAGQSHSLGPEMKGRFLDTLADDYRLARAAQDAGLHKSPEVMADIWNRDRESALLAFSESYLGGLKPDEASLRSHHTAHPERFNDLGSGHLLLIVAESQERAEKALLESLGGSRWEDLFEAYANAESTGDWDMGWVEFKTLAPHLPPDALKALLDKPVGHVVGPVALPDGFALFKVLDRRPGPPLPFESCAEAVRIDYLRERGPELVAGYLDGEGRNGIRCETHPELATARKGG